jgi:hypothetical protein
VLGSDGGPYSRFRQGAILGKRHDDTSGKYSDAGCYKMARPLFAPMARFWPKLLRYQYVFLDANMSFLDSGVEQETHASR